LVTGKAAAGTARGPAADNAGEHPGIAAGTDDHQPARTKFVDGLFSKPGQCIGSVGVPRRVEVTLNAAEKTTVGTEHVRRSSSGNREATRQAH
jgi:hypothetical protein